MYFLLLITKDASSLILIIETVYSLEFEPKFRCFLFLLLVNITTNFEVSAINESFINFAI